MLLIVLSHVVQSMDAFQTAPSVGKEFMLPLSCATTDIRQFILTLMRYCGSFGNLIFFTCSCWFLLESKKTSAKKIFYMLADVWVISIIILAVMEIMTGGRVDWKHVIKSIFPTTFDNNWYITCYVLFYAIHQVLNKIIYSMGQKELLKACVILSLLYIAANNISVGTFQGTALIVWIAIYFDMAYMKIYLKKYTESKAVNYGCIMFGWMGNLVLMLLTNCLGLHFLPLYNQLEHWSRASNPFLIITAVGLLNLANSTDFKNKMINGISSLSLLVYVIHENIMLRRYRGKILMNIYYTYGFNYILARVSALAVVIFIISAMFAVIYKASIQKITKRAVDKLYACIGIFYHKVENLILKLG